MKVCGVRKQQIAAEWRRAVLAQAAAEALLDARLPEDAVSRAYYAVLHAARSVLFAHETVPELTGECDASSVGSWWTRVR